MKKKVMAVALVVIILAVTVGGTLAWFTDSDAIKNIFTVGSVKVEQIETGKDGGAFQQNQPLIPVVDESDAMNDPNFIVKKVTATNKGRNPAYVRTSIAVPSALVGYVDLVVNANQNGSSWKWDFTTTDVDVNGENYVVYTYYYDKVVEKYDAASDALDTTTVLLEGVYLKADVDLQDNPATTSTNLELCRRNADGSCTFTGVELTDADGKMLVDPVTLDLAATIDVLVATQAVQSEGFAGAKAALDAAFGVTLPDFAALD